MTKIRIIDRSRFEWKINNFSHFTKTYEFVEEKETIALRLYYLESMNINKICDLVQYPKPKRLERLFKQFEMHYYWEGPSEYSGKTGLLFQKLQLDKLNI